jgi:hypothetical protein
MPTICRLSATAYSIFQYIRSYRLISGGRILHPQSVDTSWHGDKAVYLTCYQLWPISIFDFDTNYPNFPMFYPYTNRTSYIDAFCAVYTSELRTALNIGAVADGHIRVLTHAVR